MTAISFRQAGWVWEGVATHCGVWPTVYGIGEGARYFGLPGVNFMFHPNNEINLAKLAFVPRVVADISKWKFEHVVENGTEVGFKGVHCGDPETVLWEAENLSRLALQFPNVVGGIIDDFTVLVDRYGCTPEQQAAFFSALRSVNSDLQMWVVAYSHQLHLPLWRQIADHLDVANLWLWNCQEIPHLAEHVARCAEVFPGKSIVVGSYLRDFPTRAGVPLELLQLQYETMLRLWEEGKIAGYSILGAFLIDQDVAQAEWVRDFLARH